MGSTASPKKWAAVMTSVLLSQAPALAAGQLIYENGFAAGADGWTPVNQASLSPLARRPGGRSLLIRQYGNEQADSAWLSPVFANPQAPVRVSLWAADNYLNTPDHSFSAAFELLPCDADGNLANTGSGDWTYIPWDSERFMPQFLHTFTESGLLWKHYEAVKQVAGSHFRLRLGWPKTRMQGECHFTDIRLSVASPKPLADPSMTTATTPTSAIPYRLEISTAEIANLFLHDEPLRFEFLLYRAGGGEIEPLDNPTIEYSVTDFEQFQIAAGALPFQAAAPLAASSRGMEQALRTRTPNLHLSATLPDPAAAEVGRQFFLEAKLLDAGRTLATDTITYAVVNPRQLPEERLDEARFIAFYTGGGFRNTAVKHDNHTLAGRIGESLAHTWDYNGWKAAQPNQDSPIDIQPGPSFPKLVYCPNLEQVRGRKPGHPWGDMSRMAPAWALLDDPFNPGCQTFDIPAYVNYIVAYVRANRQRIVQVVPSGLERSIDARTLELHRQAYAAIKAEFPDLPVGMMVWGILGAEGVDLILREKLYEVADFFDTHVYLSAVDWTEWNRLRRELARRGAERRLISTEFARVGGTNQLQRARDMVTSQLDAHAHDMYRLTYFNMYVGNNAPLRQAILREDFPGDGFQWMQYVDRPRIAATIEGENWRPGLYGNDHRGSSMMPMLQAISHYNFVQTVEGATFKTVFQPSDRSIAYVYERDGQTVCYLFLREPAPPTCLALATDQPYTMRDVYGRTDRVTPAGVSLVVATLDPLALVFDGLVPALHDAKTAAAALKPVDGGLELPTIARGTTATAVLDLPPIFDRPLTVRVAATVDGTWPLTTPQPLPVAAGQPARLELPIAVAADRPAGTYTFTTRIYDGERLLSVLKQPLRIQEMLTVSMRGLPMTKTTDPAIAVTVHSLADTPMAGTIRLANRFFGNGFEPDPLDLPYAVDPQGSAEIRFPLPRQQANLASSYLIQATLQDNSGFAIRCQDDISFQASVKTTTPIVVDGDLADWRLDELLPIPFERWHRGPRPAAEFSGHFYSRWDDEKLYFAAIVTDQVPVATGVDQIEWNDDNIMLGLYPWRWQMGEPLNTGYYREHLGPLKDGGASFMRVGYVPSGPATAEGAEIAVRRTADGWIYEWAYPKATLHPLDLVDGGGFRLSLTVWDQHQVPKTGWGKFTWLTFAGFNTSVNAQPNLWRQFTLAPAPAN